MTHRRGPDTAREPWGVLAIRSAEVGNFEGSCHLGVALVDLTPALELAT